MARLQDLGPLDPIFDVDKSTGAIATGNTPGDPRLTVTINTAAGQLDPADTEPVLFTVVFSRAVTGFETGDVSLSGTAGATTGTVTETAPFDGTTYQVAVTGMTDDGTIIANVPSFVATAVDDGVANSGSTSTDNMVIWVATTYTTMSLVDPNTSSNTFTRQFFAPFYRPGSPPEVTIKSGGGGAPLAADESLGRIVTAEVAFAEDTEYRIVLGGCRNTTFLPNGGDASGTNNRDGAGSSALLEDPYHTVSEADNDIVIVAGAGGAHPSGTNPGGNGGPVGGDGGSSADGAGGGTQSAGGVSGGPGGSAGAFYQGGNSSGAGTSHGGGGGGWYGGGGGGTSGSGGGGSSRVNSPAVYVSDSANALNAVAGASVVGDFRDPYASVAQREAGAELTFGFHEMLDYKEYNLSDGTEHTPSQSSGVTGGRRRTASPNDYFMKGQGGSGSIDFTLDPSLRPPAAGSGHDGWMIEGFFQTSSLPIANGDIFHLNDGASGRIVLQIDNNAPGGRLTLSLSSSAGTLLATTAVATGLVINTWYHFLLELTAADQWNFYLDGVLEHGPVTNLGDMSAELFAPISGAGSVSSRHSVACFAIHTEDRYSAGYITSVIDAFEAV